MKTKFIAMYIEPSEGQRPWWLPEGTPVPDAIFVTARDMMGQHFLHLPRVLPFDRGHDWNVVGGRVSLSPAVREGVHLVLQYGPMPCCDDCGQELSVGCRYCPQCGTETSSLVEAGSS